MRALLRNTIAKECNKLVTRHFEYLNELHEYTQRRSRREGKPFKKQIHKPAWWDVAPQFNPFKVRLGKKLDTYAHTLTEKIRRRKYQPKPALIRIVRKHDGSPRKLNVFQIPDAAVSHLVYKSLLHKNLSRLSGHAFAYREDRTPHDAVNEIFSEWRNVDRIYVAEYDFSKFFDAITHDYLRRVIEEHRFIVSIEERAIIEAFLSSEACERNSYPQGATKRTRGIPQGTSISLFLANVVCWELDRGLERLGVGFCRYADDTVVWSEDYEKVVRAYYLIDDYSRKIGVPINLLKSQGINLIGRKHGRAEIASKSSIDYLGYRISLSDLSIAKRNVAKLKAKISFIVYQNLIQPLVVSKIFNRARLTASLDLDYVTALKQIRFYLYGGLTEDKLRSYIAGRIPDLHFRGLMSYYPIVTDVDQLSRLDGWLVHVLRQSLRLRQKLWQSHTGQVLPGPVPGWIDIIDELGLITPMSGSKRPIDLTFPRFRTINNAMRLAITRKGIMSVANPRSSRYY
jgi:RNA-directed DNA polymerase